MHSFFIDQKNLDPQLYTGYIDLRVKSHTGNIFYAPPLKTNKEDYRDCIDIAVKIAFKLNQKQDINELSNQAKLNSSVIDDSANRILIKELQSSNLETSQKTRELLKKNKGVISTPIIKSLEQLESLDEHIRSFYQQFPDLDIKITGKESEEAYVRMLFQSVQDFGLDFQNILNRFEMFLNKSNKSIEDFLGNNTDANGNTVLHLAVAEQEHEAIDILLSKMKNEDIIKKTANEYLNTALHIATRNNDINAVKKLIYKFNTPQEEKNLDIFLEARDNFGFTALHSAVVTGCTNIIPLLLDKMKDGMLTRVIQTNYEDGGAQKQVLDSLTLLHLAVYSGNSEIVQILCNILSRRSVQFSQFFTAVNGDEYTPLHLALVKNEKNFKLFLSQIKAGTFTVYDERFNDYKPVLDYKLLRSVVGTGNNEIVKTLLEFLSDEQILQLISLNDSDGYNILHFAVLSGVITVKLFLDKLNPARCSKIITDVKYHTLDFAAQHATGETMKVLLDAVSSPLSKSQSYDVLCQAVQTLNIEAINVFLENQNFDSHAINNVDSNNRNILYYILLPMLSGHHKGEGTIELLNFLADKSDFSKLVNAQDINGQTVLHFAAAVGDIEIVKWLIGKMSTDTINASDKNKNTALDIAVKKCNFSTVELLINEKMSADIINKVNSHLDLIYSIVNTLSTGQYDTEELKKAYSFLMDQEAGEIKDSQVINGIVLLVHSKAHNLAESGIKKLIANKFQELQYVQEEVAYQEYSTSSNPSHTFIPEVKEVEEIGRDSNLFD